MRVVKNIVRVLAIICLIVLIFVFGVETGSLSPILFKHHICKLQNTIKGSHFKRFFIRSIKGGTVWDINVTDTDIIWKKDDHIVAFKAPYISTGFKWKDVLFAKDGHDVPARVTIFYPSFEVKISEEEADAFLLNNFLMLFNNKITIPVKNIQEYIDFDLESIDIINGNIVFITNKGRKITVEDFSTTYKNVASLSKKKESTKEIFSLMGKLLNKKVFLSFINKEDISDVFSITEDLFFNKNMVVNVKHDHKKKSSDISLFLEDLFLIEGNIEYLDGYTFRSSGKIKPENIFWKESNTNKILWRILKEVDPFRYDCSYYLTGSKSGLKINLTLTEAQGKKFCFIIFKISDTSKIEFDINISGSVIAKGTYDTVKNEVFANVNFHEVKISRGMFYLGIEKNIELSGVFDGSLGLTGPINQLTLNGKINIGKGSFLTMDFLKAEFNFSGTGRFIFLEDSKFVRENGDIPVVGYFDLGLKNMLRNVKIKPKNSLVWSGIDFIRDKEGKTYTLEKALSDKLTLKVLREFGEKPESVSKDEMEFKIELDLDGSNKFFYKQDDEKDFLGLERTIKF
ncbi:MAG: hypothetical protein KAI43_08805 [Candidatus Aureabacteria bacterium]|nr:hypothetical protein [Candidatus Auribacterota bacterium]